MESIIIDTINQNKKIKIMNIIAFDIVRESTMNIYTTNNTKNIIAKVLQNMQILKNTINVHKSDDTIKIINEIFNIIQNASDAADESCKKSQILLNYSKNILAASMDITYSNDIMNNNFNYKNNYICYKCSTVLDFNIVHYEEQLFCCEECKIDFINNKSPKKFYNNILYQ